MKKQLKDIRWIELSRYLKEIRNIMGTLKIEVESRKRDRKEYIGLVVIERIMRRYNYATERLKASVEKQFGEADKHIKLDKWSEK